jgi:putative DNA-invertase from lambdoid prophage Rac
MKLCATCRLEFRREQSRKIKAGLARAKAAGKRLARQPLDDLQLLVRVAQLRKRGYSIRGIARAFRVSKTWVWKAVQCSYTR